MPMARRHDGYEPPRPPPPAEPPPLGSLVQALVAWLVGISTWKRAFIAVLLGCTSLVVVLTYQHPDRAFNLLDGAIRAHGLRGERVSMTPLYSDVQRGVDRLERTFGPSMIGVMAWRVDLDTNRQKVAAFATTEELRATAAAVDRQRWQVELPLFGANPVVNHLLGQIIAGRFACAPAAEAWPALKAFPVVEVCLLGVPPDEGEPLGGFLAGGWREPISDDDRRRIEAAFRAVAQELVWRTQAR